jgi:hypothetical protein
MASERIARIAAFLKHAPVAAFDPDAISSKNPSVVGVAAQSLEHHATFADVNRATWLKMARKALHHERRA